MQSVTQWRVSKGILDSSNRDSLFTASNVTPGQKYEFKFPILPTEYTFPAGHQVGVVLLANFSMGVANTRSAVVTVDTKASKVILPITGGSAAATASAGFVADTTAPVIAAPDVTVEHHGPDRHERHVTRCRRPPTRRTRLRPSPATRRAGTSSRSAPRRSPAPRPTPTATSSTKTFNDHGLRRHDGQRRHERHRAGHAVADAGHAGGVRRVHARHHEDLRVLDDGQRDHDRRRRDAERRRPELVRHRPPGQRHVRRCRSRCRPAAATPPTRPPPTPTSAPRPRR